MTEQDVSMFTVTLKTSYGKNLRSLMSHFFRFYLAAIPKKIVLLFLFHVLAIKLK
jgi:hypothetical protein